MESGPDEMGWLRMLMASPGTGGGSARFFHGRDGLRAVRLIISAPLNFRFPARIFDDEHEHDDEDDLLAAPPRYDLRVPEAAFAT
jgi:hypothetical protein